MINILFPAIAANILPHLPLYLVWIAAIIVAIVSWRKNPRVSLFTVIGVAGILIINLVGTIVSVSMPITLQRQGFSGMRISTTVTIWNIASSVLTAGCWGLIVAAIFGWRKSAMIPPSSFPMTPPTIPNQPMQ